MLRAIYKIPVLIATLLLTCLCVAPHPAFAGDALQAAEVIAQPETETAPAASVSYAAGGGGSFSWKADGQTSSVASGKQFSALRMRLGGEIAGGIQYQVYVKGAGWKPLRANNKVAGSASAKAGRIEAVRIALTGEASMWYDVRYRVQASSGSLQAWKQNGQVAGKVGASLKGIEVQLSPKSAKSEAAGDGIVGVRYRARLVGAKWQVNKANNAVAGSAKRSKRIQSFSIALDKGALSGGVKYRVRLSSGKWSGWKKNGAATRASKNIEAIQVKLTGQIAKSYDVVYRTYVSGVGWQARVRNGAVAGTSKGYRIGAFKVQIVSKDKRSGWVGSGKSWGYYKRGTQQKGCWITTSESPINVLTAKTQTYWLDADGKLAVGRIVNPKSTKDEAAGYAAYATKAGYLLKHGKQSTSKGVLLANSKGRLATVTGWVQTSAYGGGTQRYYLESAGIYSMPKTGLFKVGSSQYYGIPGVGYVMRDDIRQIDGLWYLADADGVLSKGMSTEDHIEQYVRWAVAIANDNSHGYTQNLTGRWGPDYDCSSLVISSLKNTGLKVGGAVYTGNMKSELTKYGFKWHTDLSNVRRGDILLVHKIGGRQHTEIYLGKGQTVGAHIAENGTIYGVTGDQTGHEIDVGPYYQSIWQGYLRFGS